jgi:hypothetical protein
MDGDDDSAPALSLRYQLTIRRRLKLLLLTGFFLGGVLDHRKQVFKPLSYFSWIMDVGIDNVAALPPPFYGILPNTPLSSFFLI